jgi:hypothetical protein
MNSVFVLVWVYRGFIQEPEFFRTRLDAEIREKEILDARFNPDYDELEVFEKSYDELSCPASRPGD